MKEKIKKLWKWLRKNVINKEMLVWVIIAEVIFWSPCIVTGLLAIIINKWYWTAFTAIIVFWSGPFTPAVPIQIGLAIGLKKLYNIITKKKRRSKPTNEKTRDSVQEIDGDKTIQEEPTTERPGSQGSCEQH